MGPWVTDWAEMAKKTALRRLSKFLSFSPEDGDALEKDGDVIDGEVMAKTQAPAGAPSFIRPKLAGPLAQCEHGDDAGRHPDPCDRQQEAEPAIGWRQRRLSLPTTLKTGRGGGAGHHGAKRGRCARRQGRRLAMERLRAADDGGQEGRTGHPGAGGAAVSTAT
jgi:hypothetical protein